MSLPNILVGIVAFVALALGFANQDAIQPKLGAFASPDVYSRMSFFDGFESGGKYTSVSTTSASYTLSAGEFKSGVVDVESTATGAALTLTLPATTTSAYPAKPGMQTELLVKNSHTAAATTTTIAAGAGVDLQETDGGNVVIGINNYARVTCTRLDTFDVACEVNETIPAD